MLKIIIPQLPNLKVLGDAHLGRIFKEGVPLHRRGEREQKIGIHFMSSLIEGVEEHDVIVQTGDLFDGFVVDAATLMFTISAVQEAQAQTGAIYIFYRGNHDASRDINKVSSFDLFQKFFEYHENIHVLTEVCTIGLTTLDGTKHAIGFMPWHPFKSALELAEEFEAPQRVVFTHCDLDQFGDNSFNVMPYAELAQITNLVINGHVHTPEIRQHGTMEVHMIGSMEPYSHGEDPNGEQYVSVTLAELAQIHPHIIHDKNVRLILAPGEEPPTVLPDCMAFTIKKMGVKVEMEDNDEVVELSEFSVEKLLAQSLMKAEVNSEVSQQLLAHYAEIKGN